MPPCHYEIADDLRRQITSGRLQPGERLPSEAALAERYAVTTVTLRHALAALQGERLVEKIHGKGNFVRHAPRKILYVGGWGMLDPLTATGPALRITVRSAAILAHGSLGVLLKVPTGSPLAELSCLTLDGETPQGLARIYTLRDLAPAGVLDGGSAHQEALARFAVLGVLPATIREAVCARSATPDEASALKIPAATAVLAVTRIATDSTGRITEAARLAFPADRVDAVFTTHHVIDERQTSP
ncbi:GntR family transcriptional regulator [Streptomyces sp. NBC_01171]|uniref:GntR family transcriptional regulator n=1 Tax=Streptomyces sp. NBC_01171 TaxID=2903757 RepID=UPI003868AAF0